MKPLLVSTILVLVLLICSTAVSAQESEEDMLNRMRQYEQNALKTYLEYQKLYYEDKARVPELQAFENLLTVYTNQVGEIYETLNLSGRDLIEPRDILARTQLFKALMDLEKAPLNLEFYEKACYEYYEALSLYDGSKEPPVVYKDLPQPILAGDRTYFRLLDLLDAKGQGLQEYGKAIISFRNFRVTADFHPQQLQLVKVSDPTDSRYTHLLAEARLREAFSEVFQKNRPVETYMALPQGTYVLQLRGSRQEIDYSPLTRFYVRKGQVHRFVMEPLADWLILYELPTSKRPDFQRFRRNRESGQPVAMANGFSVQTDGHDPGKKSDEDDRARFGSYENQVVEIVAYHAEQVQIEAMFDSTGLKARTDYIDIIARAIVQHVKSRAFYEQWGPWPASWEIASTVRDDISPGHRIPVQLAKLIYLVIGEL